MSICKHRSSTRLRSTRHSIPTSPTPSLTDRYPPASRNPENPPLDVRPILCGQDQPLEVFPHSGPFLRHFVYFLFSSVFSPAVFCGHSVTPVSFRSFLFFSALRNLSTPSPRSKLYCRYYVPVLISVEVVKQSNPTPHSTTEHIYHLMYLPYVASQPKEQLSFVYRISSLDPKLIKDRRPRDAPEVF